MESIMERLVTEIAVALEPRLSDAGIRVTADWPDRERDMPLGCGIVAVGLQDTEAVPGAFSDYLGVDGGQGIYGRLADVVLSLTACSPPSKSGEGCRKIFGLLCDALLFDLPGHDVRRVWCGKAAYQKELGALTLPCYAKLRVQLSQSREDSGATRFTVRRVTK